MLSTYVLESKSYQIHTFYLIPLQKDHCALMKACPLTNSTSSMVWAAGNSLCSSTCRSILMTYTLKTLEGSPYTITVHLAGGALKASNNLAE